MDTPRVGIVGPLLGTNPGWVRSPGELLASRLRAEGVEVQETSRFPGRIPRLIDTLAALRRWHDRVDVAVVLVFSGAGFAMADVTTAAARRLGIPAIAWLHGGNLPVFERRHTGWVRRVLCRATTVVAPSAYLAALARNHPWVEIVPNLLPEPAYPFRLRTRLRPRLLWMRTFEDVYRPQMAIEVVRRLVEAGVDDVALTMAGQDRGLLGPTRQAARAAGVFDRITFAGFLGPEAKLEALSSHDVYLHTNAVDNAPVSVLEAASAGLPLVVNAVGGIPALLEHEGSCLMVPDGDAGAMTASVIRLLHDPELAARLSDGGRAVAARSTWPEQRDRWLAILGAVTRAPRALEAGAGA